MRVVLAGATGLVGSMLAPLLACAGYELHVVSRCAVPGAPPEARVHAAEPAAWPAIVRTIAADAAVSTLGTTMAKAGSQRAFAAVDLDLLLAFAEAARAGGARTMATVSSVGADAASRNFYLRIKGEADAGLDRLGFDRLDIFRPGLLRGPRGADRRLGERMAIALSPAVNALLRGPLSRYAAIDAADIAAAISATLREKDEGRFVHENRAIRRLARL
jgi:uncharacterized protein YbjT (DUF2867 family)